MKKSNKVNKWSGKVTRESNALDLERGVFTWKDPDKIAHSLAHSAQESTRRKTDPYRSATSMLNFYINRGGKNLPEGQKTILKHAQAALKGIFKK